MDCCRIGSGNGLFRFISGCGDDKKAAADKIVRVAGTVSVSSSSMDPAKDGMAGTLSATVSVRRCLK